MVTRLLCLASLLALVNCGITIAARMPRMITTIRISIRVKPFLAVLRAYMGMLLCVRCKTSFDANVFCSDDPYGAGRTGRPGHPDGTHRVRRPTPGHAAEGYSCVRAAERRPPASRPV